MSTSTAISQGTLTEAQFDAAAVAYSADKQGAKFKRVVDALAACGIDEREDILARVEDLIGQLEYMAENGHGYTPPSEKNFGSDNAAVVAEKILGKAQTVGATRTAFSDWGKTVKARG